ncbi:hypothetical protein KPE82_10750 [Acinetobacter baumannii]|uniref:hypothetical protein n=1 Tax=Acinetobacter baumannii TaxID=470 RepID=UPI001C0B8B5E|nr:hypothetical protein [Acinetobacter baumannii]MBU3096081.1 hypothetical protein [Acinetobacter baumannii]MDO7500259.1 hypothetical protein [Acinetobacter baumannii]MDV7441277.1 hypothetical protein [Acinetobacter baumannii]
MLNFEQLYKNGINAALNKEKNVAEIGTAINIFKSELENASDNQLTITTRTANLSDLFKKTYLNTDKVELHDIVISICRTDNPKNLEDITKLEYSSTGFPCSIYIESNRYTYSTKEALLQGFGDLLQNQTTGTKILKLLNKDS